MDSAARIGGVPERQGLRRRQDEQYVIMAQRAWYGAGDHTIALLGRFLPLRCDLRGRHRVHSALRERCSTARFSTAELGCFHALGGEVCRRLHVGLKPLNDGLNVYNAAAARSTDPRFPFMPKATSVLFIHFPPSTHLFSGLPSPTASRQMAHVAYYLTLSSRSAALVDSQVPPSHPAALRLFTFPPLRCIRAYTQGTCWCREPNENVGRKTDVYPRAPRQYLRSAKTHCTLACDSA
ncbi:hypothetical protein C8R45DRAFT_1001899 [Mycena sanguinolenta]|nr:hypothetical protein C8R45DRAFT_1001899 [Mycena sanguinolenta]